MCRINYLIVAGIPRNHHIGPKIHKKTSKYRFRGKTQVKQTNCCNLKSLNVRQFNGKISTLAQKKRETSHPTLHPLPPLKGWKVVKQLVQTILQFRRNSRMKSIHKAVQSSWCRSGAGCVGGSGQVCGRFSWFFGQVMLPPILSRLTVGADAELIQAADIRWPTSSVARLARRNDFNHFGLGQSKSTAWVKRPSAATS